MKKIVFKKKKLYDSVRFKICYYYAEEEEVLLYVDLCFCMLWFFLLVFLKIKLRKYLSILDRFSKRFLIIRGKYPIIASASIINIKTINYPS